MAQLLPQRKNDLFIMENLMAMGTKGKILEEINICMKYLRVTCWSDISTGNGKKISVNAWKGKEKQNTD